MTHKPLLLAQGLLPLPNLTNPEPSLHMTLRIAYVDRRIFFHYLVQED